MDGLWDGTKHLWELLITALSAGFSYMVYRHKKNREQFETMADTVDEHESILQVFEERFKHLMNDVEEIKKDLKKILFKL
jgi:hypothetical protein